jgi:hypothetical protein
MLPTDYGKLWQEVKVRSTESRLMMFLFFANQCPVEP